ncbi:MAG: GNAT family N-acetyltransferase [Oscillospiraceae bacterium]|nr:GNAT family N-acetyltransferase [Oscillospiraceae bacterium]
MVEIRRIGAGNAADAKLKNEPFSVWGRMIPALQGGVWSLETERFAESTEMCFPDVPYDAAAEDALFLGAYDGTVCVGLAVLRRGMFRYLLLDDLKVVRAYRGRGIGRRLVEACLDEARAEGLQGVSLVAQDDNLSACLFYLRCGFELGGFNNRDYRGTPQARKADLYFYRDC